MATATADSNSTRERQWFIVGRWQEYEGEGRTNLLRALAVAIYYAVHLVNYFNYHSFYNESPPPEYLQFHTNCTYLAAGWLFLSLAVLVSLQRQYLPSYLKYVVATIDLLLLTALIALHGGPASPLASVYFLLIGLAGLRFSLSLIWLTTAGSLLSFLALVWKFDKVPFDTEHPVPIINQLVMLVGLVMMGVIVGQLVRRVRGIAEDFRERMERAEGKG